MDITIENSWHKEGGLWLDSDLKKVKASRLRYHPKPFAMEDCQPDSVLTLRGPRRAGKTIALKLLVVELIETHGISPEKILWMSFEALRTLEQIEERMRAAAQNQPRVLFIDEATSVVGWQRVIKKIKDEGMLNQSTVLLTGSSAHDLKLGAERMAGRRGKVERPDRVLLPMSFLDFEKQVMSHRAFDDLELVLTYAKVGGFPFRVETYLESDLNKFDSMSQFQVFDDVFFYEINRRRLDRNIAIEVIGRLSQIGVHAISTDALAKPLSISRETAKRYLDALGDSFLLATVFSFDTSRSRVAPRKDRKYVWIDPALADFAAWLGVGQVAQDAEKIEMIVGAELLRRHERRLWEGLSAPRNIFTWKSSGGNEIDFLQIHAAEKIKNPFEIKYQNEISDWDFQVMERAFHRGLLITKHTNQQRPKSRATCIADFLRGFLGTTAIPNQ